MHRRGGLLAAGAAAAALALGWTLLPVGAQTDETAPAAPADATAGGGAAGAPGPYLVIQVAGEAEGEVVIDLNEEAAPKHAARLQALAENGAYDGVVFHRVIEGFMAQTGDVEYGKTGANIARAGTGGSHLPDLEAEFSDIAFERGVVGMARSNNPDSANSQFFIMFGPAGHLNGQYTVVGEVVEGMDVVDAIKLGTGGNGAIVGAPDVMEDVEVRAAEE
ncbi:peptidyl-prolyl cis-trans isomerase, cyclophilin-type [Oceanicola granulosus HTCC2516]|uniref:Peptidyl-prolyl cis-trans isomerase n=1 Tax=Oceanicola granulosus (strain ATCC BAA-861 / DSM 15982 / KCTC 12143 / HTCC2516) TaxID=314256 RepID=Q2CE81_OCEGH|nr:peptidylprolyl isomerase [Oceanicola granulosus]EAR50979.1 peptidyl-prolyl cis-trans isomerase, cyclophilin-type [Oceanicola granulosus HTCC2516]